MLADKDVLIGCFPRSRHQTITGNQIAASFDEDTKESVNLLYLEGDKRKRYTMQKNRDVLSRLVCTQPLRQGIRSLAAG